MKPGYLSRECMHVLNQCRRQIPAEFEDAWLHLTMSFLRPKLQATYRDVFEANDWARERLNIPYNGNATARPRKERARC